MIQYVGSFSMYIWQFRVRRCMTKMNFLWYLLISCRFAVLKDDYLFAVGNMIQKINETCNVWMVNKAEQGSYIWRKICNNRRRQVIAVYEVCVQIHLLLVHYCYLMHMILRPHLCLSDLALCFCRNIWVSLVHGTRLNVFVFISGQFLDGSFVKDNHLLGHGIVGVMSQSWWTDFVMHKTEVDFDQCISQAAIGFRCFNEATINVENWKRTNTNVVFDALEVFHDRVRHEPIFGFVIIFCRRMR